MQYDRRTILKSAAIGVLGASTGCLDGVGSGNEQMNTALTADTGGAATGTGSSAGTATTASDSDTTATRTETANAGETSSPTESAADPTCGGGLRPLRIDFPENFELAYRQGFDFELNADPDTVEIGDRLAITLRNTTDETQTTGPKAKYAIERRIEDGWQHVLEVPEAFTPPRGRVTHQPGEGFTWRFPVTQNGFSVEPYTVCGSLQPGEYHFTYWGFPDAKRGLTIAFEIE